jgi:hypothetical protein
MRSFRTVTDLISHFHNIGTLRNKIMTHRTKSFTAQELHFFEIFTVCWLFGDFVEITLKCNHGSIYLHKFQMFETLHL